MSKRDSGLLSAPKMCGQKGKAEVSNIKSKLLSLTTSYTFYCCSVTKLCPALFDPMDCSMPGSSVLHCLSEFAQIHVHWIHKQKIILMKDKANWTSPVVQWLRLWTPNVGGMGSVPGQGSKILQASWQNKIQNQKSKTKQTNKKTIALYDIHSWKMIDQKDKNVQMAPGASFISQKLK